jgi:hypothetical protein
MTLGIAISACLWVSFTLLISGWIAMLPISWKTRKEAVRTYQDLRSSVWDTPIDSSAIRQD